MFFLFMCHTVNCRECPTQRSLLVRSSWAFKWLICNKKSPVNFVPCLEDLPQKFCSFLDGLLLWQFARVLRTHFPDRCAFGFQTGSLVLHPSAPSVACKVDRAPEKCPSHSGGGASWLEACFVSHLHLSVFNLRRRCGLRGQ